MLFFTNLKNIICYLPLILSDSTDAKDISFTRVLIAFLTVLLIILAYHIVYKAPQYIDQLMPYITDIIKTILALVVANITKRVVAVVETRLSKKEG